MSDCSVLLVDDAAEIRSLIKMFLQMHEGIAVVGEATNGQEAVDLCAAHQPDVVLLDISMPIMDGLQALPLIRDVSPRTHVLMLSGFTTEAIKAEALSLGACAFIDKGTPGAQIVAAVQGNCCS